MSSSSSSSASESEDDSSLHPGERQRNFQADDDHDSSDHSDTEGSEESDPNSEGEDAPVLSHAEKRRQNKKERKAAKPSATAPPDDLEREAKGKVKVKNTAELPPSTLPKRQNSIWVGNLSFKTTPASLRSFFEGVGDITRIHMPMKMAAGGPEGKGPRKENRGFAYVDFATPDAKAVAITMSENPLDGRRLLIKDGDDFQGRPTPAVTSGTDGTETSATTKATGRTKTAQKILSVQKQPPGPTLFLGNLGFETTEETIRELLESHRSKEKELADSDATGPSDKWIRKIRLGTFEDSGKCKGWAFVDFTTTEHATAVLTNPRNHQLNGRKLVVEYASPEAVRRGGGGPPRADKDKDKRRQREEKGGAAGGQKRVRDQARPGGKDRGRAEVPEEDGEDLGDEEQGPLAKKRRTGDGKPAGAKGGFAGNGFGKSGAGRPRVRPGAALALAKREDVAIVPSQGKKIVF